MANYASPDWRPELAESIEWIRRCLKTNLPGKHYTLYANGSCVVWPEGQDLSEFDCHERLLAVVTNRPDFKVRNDARGDFLVTFKGGVGGALSADFLKKHLSALSAAALERGKLPSEVMVNVDHSGADDLGLIAGLYVRARLYLDAQAQKVLAVV